MQELMYQYGREAPFFPMNAKDSGDKVEKLLDNDEYVAELKYDGSRYLAVNGQFFSRVASVTDGYPVEKTANVPHLHGFLLLECPDMILDGEVYYPGEKSSDVTKIMGSGTEKAIARQEERGYIRYVVYDILGLRSEMLTHLPWRERRQILAQVYEEYLQKNTYIDLSRVASGDNKRKLLAWTQDNNEEGIMLKNRTAPYHMGARPTNVWFKVKKVMTADVVIMDLEVGKGKYAGQVGAVVFGQFKDGVLTRCGTCSGMTDAIREDITHNPDNYLSHVLELEAMERTEKGQFRHPRWVQMRLDKAPEDCTWEE